MSETRRIPGWLVLAVMVAIVALVGVLLLATLGP